MPEVIPGTTNFARCLWQTRHPSVRLIGSFKQSSFASIVTNSTPIPHESIFSSREVTTNWLNYLANAAKNIHEVTVRRVKESANYPTLKETIAIVEQVCDNPPSGLEFHSCGDSLDDPFICFVTPPYALKYKATGDKTVTLCIPPLLLKLHCLITNSHPFTVERSSGNPLCNLDPTWIHPHVSRIDNKLCLGDNVAFATAALSELRLDDALESAASALENFDQTNQAASVQPYYISYLFAKQALALGEIPEDV